MAWSGFGPYPGMWREYTQTKCTDKRPEMGVTRGGDGAMRGGGAGRWEVAA